MTQVGSLSVKVIVVSHFDNNDKDFSSPFFGERKKNFF